MSKIIVYGAAGNAGRKIVTEAAQRGHEVTAVVRDPAKHPELAGANVAVERGDVTSPDDVAGLSSGHDAAVSAVARMDMDATEFYTAAAHALIDGLTQSGVKRLVLIGIGTTLKDPAGVPVHESEGFPAEGRAFSLGHQAELEIFESDGKDLDWLILAPPPIVLDAEAPRTGNYKLGGRGLIADAAPTFGYADLAAAVVAEIDDPEHHQDLVAIAG
jgi:uncharacterized protein